MASLFASKSSVDCRLLDAGAGIGSLASAFLERCIATELSFSTIEVTAFELDSVIHEELNDSLASYTNRLAVVYKILDGDFIEQAVNNIKFDLARGFTHAILNPPYQKINSKSRHRSLLRQAGIETVNLYSAFVALALTMMAPGGQIVAIVPRSFCNGPYYRPFRDFILERAAIQHIHLFDSRRQGFKDDDVLQENIILLLESGTPQGHVTVTTSTDNNFTDLVTHTHPFDRIVLPSDSERFIHVPTSPERSHIDLSTTICYSLEDIGIKVSTGPVVDFRLKAHLRKMSEPGTVPLLYPAHFTNQNIEWPKPNIKKPNIKEVFPKANIVIDRFHVIKLVNKSLNKIRLKLGLTGLKNKALLLKNKRDLSESEQIELRELLALSPGLEIAYDFKEELKKIYESNSTIKSGLSKMRIWLKYAGLFFDDIVNTLESHLPEIANFFKNRTTSGVTEGINTKIKLILRQSYGFVSFELMREKLLACLFK